MINLRRHFLSFFNTVTQTRKMVISEMHISVAISHQMHSLVAALLHWCHLDSFDFKAAFLFP